MTDFKGFMLRGPKLDAADFGRIGKIIGVGEDLIRAIFETETAGASTDGKGRVRILFEPHRMYRNVPKAKLDAAVKAGVAYAKWGEKKYPPDSYPVLLKAIAIDEAAALKSASWGLPQLMGENYRSAGYDSVQAMVSDFMLDEDNQLEAMIRFIKTDGLDDELRVLQAKLDKGQAVTAEDCRPFVALYNGPGYAKNGYHTKFAKNIAKWVKQPDAVPAAAPAKPEPVPEKDIHLPDDGVSIKMVQQRLKDLGYGVGIVDGKMGSRTQGALLAFQNDNGLETDGKITKSLLAALMVAAPREISKERATATAADLREKGDKEIKHVDRAKTAAVFTTGLGLFSGGTELLDDVKSKSDIARSIWDNVEPVQAFLKENLWILLAGIGGIVIWQAYKIQKVRVEKHREGQDLSL